MLRYKQVEQALRKNEERCRMAIEHSNDWVAIIQCRRRNHRSGIVGRGMDKFPVASGLCYGVVYGHSVR